MGVCKMTVKRARLCYWIARPAKPGVQSSNTSRVHFTVIYPCVLAFITHISCINGIEMTLVWLIWYTLRNIFFKFAICFIALMNLGETCHLKRRATWKRCGGRCCCYVVTIVNACSSIMTSRSLNTHCDITQCMNGLWIFITKTWIAQGRFTNIILTPWKQWGVCDNRSKKTSKFHVAGLCKGNPPVNGKFPSQRASNEENVSIWWGHPLMGKVIAI